MKLGEFTDYKKAIRARAKELQAQKPSVTLKRIAERIPLQYTYLSKVLNDDRSHLSEDHVYEIAQILELFPQETDYLLLLRSYQTTAHPARKQALFKRLEKERGNLGVSAQILTGATSTQVDFRNEMNYLMDPFASIVRIALYIPAYRQDPKKLCSQLGLSLDRMKGILKTLAMAGLIETGASPFQIIKIHKDKIHFSKEHPLMRMHQYLTSIACQNQLLKTEEENQDHVQVKFAGSEAMRKEIQVEFKKFLKRVEELAGEAKNENLYQMNFQFFRWT